MKVKTSFGEVYIEAEYQSKERCKMDGYKYVETIKEGELYVINNSYALIIGY